MQKYFYLFGLLLAFLTGCKSSQKTSGMDEPKRYKIIEAKGLSSQSRVQAERLFIDGLTQKLIGNFSEAFRFFNQAINFNPDLDAAYFEIANLHLINGDYAKATENLEKAMKISPDNVFYKEYYAELLSAQYRFAEAAAMYNQLKKSNPEKLDYFFNEAYHLVKLNKFSEALKVYDEIEKIVGVTEETAVQKHTIYTLMNKKEEAANELKKLIKLDPQEMRYKNMLADFYLANGEEAKAIEIYKDVLKINPDDAIAITSLADYYKKTGDRKKYMEYYSMAFSNRNIPLDIKIMVLYNYIQFYHEVKNEMEDAYYLAEILKEAHPREAKVYAVTGDLYNISDNTEKALENYLKSLEYQKDIFSVWQQVFFIYSDKKNYEELAAITSDAMEFFPNQPIVYFFNGLAHHQLKNYEKAEKSYSKAVKMAGENVALKTQLYSNLGDVYNSLKRFSDSDESFDKALDLDPNNAYTLNNYSYYLSLRKENLDKAYEMAAKANKLMPGNASFLDTYAWVLFQKGDYKKALEQQKKALDASEEPNATLLEHYGDILFKLNKIDDAVEYWKKALDASPEEPEKLNKKIRDRQYYE
jgi:tetratricopeptide (TPR) repeat protein